MYRKWFLFSILFLFLLLALTIASYKKRKELSLWYAIKTGQPAWAKEQISGDFSDFIAHGITKEALDQTFAKIESQNIFAYRYRIIDDEIFRIGKEDGRAEIFEKNLRKIAKSVRLPNVDFIICMMDGVPENYVPNDFWIVENPDFQAPLLAWAKKESAKKVVLVPDIFMSLRDSWQRRVETIQKHYEIIPWERKIKKAFWRGTASDKGYTIDNYLQKPRFLLSRASLEAPEKVDAGFFQTNDPFFTQLFLQMGLFRSYTSIEEHLEYKYLPVLDGYMCTYPGYQWRLLSGSLTLKQESDEIQYFYSALHPYVHYLPIKNDMSDLLEKIDWAIDHDEECKRIAQSARDFAQRNLMLDSVYSYLYCVLKTYASFQTFDLRKTRVEMERDPKWVLLKTKRA